MDSPKISTTPLTITELHKFIGERSEIPSTPKSLPTDCEKADLLPQQYAEYMLRLVAAYCREKKDALELYRPLPAAVEFHACDAHQRLLVGSNQSGKSLHACAEFARIVRGRDPYKKLPAENLRTMSVGIDQDYLGQVLWKKLWYPGAFEMVPDEVDGFWRAVRVDPNDPRHVDPIDMARKALWRPAPPLLPPNEIARLAYEKAGEGIPALVALKNGTESIFCTSRGNPRQGTQMHFVHFSEELLSMKWLPDAMARLVRYDGKFMWDATPENSTPQLFELHRRVLNGDADVREFKLLIDDNPYFSDEAKRLLYNDFAALGEEILAVKWYGEYAIAGRSAYPMYSLDRHGIDLHSIPSDWMMVAAFDPGSRVQAAVIGAVPPGASHLEIPATVVVKNKDAYAFAKEFKKIAGYRRYEAFIIDKKGAQPRALGRSNTTADHYQQEFERAGVIPSRLSGHGFLFGSDDCEAREMSVKTMLLNDTLKLHRSASVMPLDHQLKNRLYDRNNPNRRESRTEHDLVDCLEYLVAFFDGGLYHNMPAQLPSAMSRYDRLVCDAIEQSKRPKRKRRRITGFAVN